VKILIADDDPTTRRMLEAFLVKWGYEVMVANQGDEAWETLRRSDAPRLAILDWMMPGMDGVQVCREVRKRKGRPYVYILLLTAKGQKRDIVAGLEAGADDYLTKPLYPYELRACLRAGRRIVELQGQLVSAHAALEERALLDPLTGLWNRGAIVDFLQRELARAARERNTVAVAMVDLDHFKAINDTYGYLAGDTVLREVARRLRSAMRTYDAMGRYGGDEFLAVVAGWDAPGAISFAESFRARIDRKAIDTPEGMIPVTLSVGVAVSSGEANPGGLIRAADAALYRAKSKGRNRVEMAMWEEVAVEAHLRLPAEASPPNTVIP